MRFETAWRVVRFLFYPISLFGCVMILNWSSNYDLVSGICDERNVCKSHCTQDNFPLLTCAKQELKVTYNGNDYDDFFFYPNPDKNKIFLEHLKEIEIYEEAHKEKEAVHKHYQECLDTLELNEQHPYAELDPTRQWRVHTCFESCREPGQETGFTIDNRPECSSTLTK